MNAPLAPEALLVHPASKARLGLDQRPLFELGMAQVRAYARRNWTDHNIHDPGVTILEQLSYALTDVCRRSAFPIEDLLATAAKNADNMGNQFFSVAQSLPNRPVTLRDYRKLLIDIYGVRNAWLFPKELVYYADPVEGKLHREDRLNYHEVNVRGLHSVLIDYDDKAIVEWTKVKAEILKLLNANRCLCQDFVGVNKVPTQDFILCAEINLAPSADTARTLSAIWFVVQRYLAPPVRIYTREALLSKTRKSDGSRITDTDLFDGPLLKHGFIDDEELARAELRSEIRLSDLISEVMDIPGVREVRDMIIRPADEDAATPPESKWRVAVKAGMRATLDRVSSRVVLYKGNMPVQPIAGAAESHYDELDSQEREQIRPAFPQELPSIPLGRPRQIGHYTSFQRHFPAVYGIGEAGLPANAGPGREAQASQLQGYLLHFDQLMANAMAQLANVRTLFSRDSFVTQTYFDQKVEPLQALYPGPIKLETETEMLARRSRFLDHLIARTGERLKDHLEVAVSAFGAAPAAAVRARCQFLDDYPELSARRGLGYDYTEAASADSASGLEHRLYHLLGLGAIVHEAYAELHDIGEEQFRFNVRRRDDDSLLLSGTDRFATRAQALVAMERAVEFARLPPGYKRQIATDGRRYFSIVDETDAVIARSAGYFADEAEMSAAILELTALLHEHFRERILVIENILLRPEAADEPFLRICPDPGCTDCAGFDPYSFRLHIALPAYAGRFRDMDFRRYAEEVIRQETPAHVLPKICWLDEAAMSNVDDAWSAWMALLAGTDGSRPTRLAKLEKALFESKSTYPAQRLHGCDAPESKPKFILGRSALGSTPTGNP